MFFNQGHEVARIFPVGVAPWPLNALSTVTRPLKMMREFETKSSLDLGSVREMRPEATVLDTYLKVMGPGGYSRPRAGGRTAPGGQAPGRGRISRYVFSLYISSTAINKNYPSSFSKKEVPF